MSEDAQFRATLAVAFRHIDATDTTRSEQESILATMALKLSGPEGELASRALHHMRTSAALQLEMRTLFDTPAQPES